jgi:hypothetical protein
MADERKAEDRELVFAFLSPYVFEGVEYKELDLSGLRRLSGQDLADVEHFCVRTGANGVQPELSFDACAFLASRVSGLPIEFFTNMPILEARATRNRVRAFLQGLV